MFHPLFSICYSEVAVTNFSINFQTVYNFLFIPITVNYFYYT